MNRITEPADGRSIFSTWRPWLVFLASAAATAPLIASLPRAGIGLSPQTRPTTQSATTLLPAVPRMASAPTFAAAAVSLLRLGRFAEAYGRFVELADEGDVDAARIALVMHRFGPDVFGSSWDASAEQLENWTIWREAAAAKDLLQLHVAANESEGRRSAEVLAKPVPAAR